MAGELGRLANGRIFLRMIRETHMPIHLSVQDSSAMSKGSGFLALAF
jgi:hypothetical protein